MKDASQKPRRPARKDETDDRVPTKAGTKAEPVSPRRRRKPPEPVERLSAADRRTRAEIHEILKEIDRTVDETESVLRSMR